MTLDCNGHQREYRVEGTEEHITMTAESGPQKGSYLSHQTVKSSTGEELKIVIIQELETFNSVESLTVLLVDNTAHNTGLYRGKKLSYKFITYRFTILSTAISVAIWIS